MSTRGPKDDAFPVVCSHRGEAEREPRTLGFLTDNRKADAPTRAEAAQAIDELTDWLGWSVPPERRALLAEAQHERGSLLGYLAAYGRRTEAGEKVRYPVKTTTRTKAAHGYVFEFKCDVCGRNKRVREADLRPGLDALRARGVSHLDISMF